MTVKIFGLIYSIALETLAHGTEFLCARVYPKIGLVKIIEILYRRENLLCRFGSGPSMVFRISHGVA